MREMDRIATQELGLDVLQLMEYAGLNVARFTQTILTPRTSPGRVLVLAGTGNNGGDGLVAARHLANWGVQVSVVSLASPSQDRSLGQHQRQILVNCQIPLLTLTAGQAVTHIQSVIEGSDLLIDALLGFGGSGNPRPPIAELIRLANASPQPILAVDLPSGLDAATGKALDPCIRAKWTLTLGLPKVGLLTQTARPFVGELFVADIGIPPGVYHRWGVKVGPLFCRAPWLPVPLQKASDKRRTHNRKVGLRPTPGRRLEVQNAR